MSVEQFFQLKSPRCDLRTAYSCESVAAYSSAAASLALSSKGPRGKHFFGRRGPAFGRKGVTHVVLHQYADSSKTRRGTLSPLWMLETSGRAQVFSLCDATFLDTGIGDGFEKVEVTQSPTKLYTTRTTRSSQQTLLPRKHYNTPDKPGFPAAVCLYRQAFEKCAAPSNDEKLFSWWRDIGVGHPETVVFVEKELCSLSRFRACERG